MKARSAALVVDLGFGDAGKGATVDALSRRLSVPPIVVRHHGGPQAAHNVWTWGHSHTFAQFGSAALVGGRTHLSRFMLVNPLTWMSEHEHLDKITRGKLPRTTVEEEAVVITPYHRNLNRLRETLRQRDGVPVHGTTGHGVGETMQDVINGYPPVLRVGDLRSQQRTQAILDEIREQKIDVARALGATWKQMNDAFFEIPEYSEAILPFKERIDVVDRGWLGEQDADLIFEGAQGVLLDQDYGFHPHTTWSDCTFGNAEVLLDDFDGPVTKIGVLRSYMTRHGAGPFPTEDAALDLPERDNDDSGWAGRWRVGYPDLVLWHYALSVVEVDFLAVTHMDRYPRLVKYAYAYTVDGGEFAGLDPEWCDPRDLEAREALTNSLFRVEPVYGSLPPQEFFLDWLAEELETPVLMSANGRRADNRTWHLPPAPKNPLMKSPYPRRWTTSVPAPLLNEPLHWSCGEVVQPGEAYPEHVERCLNDRAT